MIEIRRATVEDARALAEVLVTSVLATHEDVFPADYLAQHDVDQDEGTWRERFDTAHDLVVWLAEDAAAPVGICATVRSDDPDATPNAAEVMALFVAPDRLRTGIGRALLAHAIDSLRERGYQEATLWVFAKNERARRFYEREGWSADGAEELKQLGSAAGRQVRYGIRL